MQNNSVPSVQSELTDEDAANIGRDLMDALRSCCPEYSWCNSPAEIVSDLMNEIADLKSGRT